MVVLWSLFQEFGLHAHVDNISFVSNHDTITWNSVLWHVSENDLGRSRAQVVTFTQIVQDSRIVDGDIHVVLVSNVSLDISFSNRLREGLRTMLSDLDAEGEGVGALGPAEEGAVLGLD